MQRNFAKDTGNVDYKYVSGNVVKIRKTEKPDITTMPFCQLKNGDMWSLMDAKRIVKDDNGGRTIHFSGNSTMFVKKQKFETTIKPYIDIVNEKD